MKYSTKNTQKNYASRIATFAAVLGLGITALFASTASAIGDTDPVVELDGTCNLFGPESPSGIWMSITNNDGWDEEYAIGVFDGIYEDDGEPILDEPLEVIFTDVESGDTEWGPILVDTLFATIQVMDLDDGGMGADLVFHDTISVCFIIPDFDFGGEDEEEDDGPGFDFDIPEFDPEPEIPDFEFDPGIDIPDFGFGDEDEGDEPVVVEDDEEDDEGDEEEGDEPVVVEDDEEGDEPVVVEGGVEDDEEGDEPVVVEGGVEDDEEGDEPVVVEGGVEDDEDGKEAPVVVEGNDDEDGEEAPVVVEGNDDNSGQDAPVEVVNNTDEGNAVFEWENITVSEATEIGRPPDPKINPEDTDDKDNDAGDSIGQPPDPKINPEDTDDKKDSEELASSEGKDSQGKSGLSILWIILIILGGITTVGTTTRAIQKNNN